MTEVTVVSDRPSEHLLSARNIPDRITCASPTCYNCGELPEEGSFVVFDDTSRLFHWTPGFVTGFSRAVREGSCFQVYQRTSASGPPQRQYPHSQLQLQDQFQPKPRAIPFSGVFYQGGLYRLDEVLGGMVSRSEFDVKQVISPAIGVKLAARNGHANIADLFTDLDPYLQFY